MKQIVNGFYSLCLVAILLATFSTSCKDVTLENDLRNVPVYMSFEELRLSVKKVEARSLDRPGKIYFKDGYIFINEEMKGIHLIDNKDPHNH
jgi:hypothetical protein